MKKKFSKINEYSSPNNSKFTFSCMSNSSADLVCGSDESKYLYIWKKNLETPILNVSCLTTLTTIITFNSTDGELYCGSKGGSVIVLDLVQSKVKQTLEAHSAVCTQLSVSDEQGVLVSGASDGKIKLWDLRQKACITTLKNHTDCIKSMAISSDGNLLASGSDDGYAKLWDMRKYRLIKDYFVIDQVSVNCIDFNPYSINIAYGSNDKTFKVWDLERHDLLSIVKDKLPVVNVKFEESGKKLFCSTNEYVRLYNLDESEPVLLDQIDSNWGRLQEIKIFPNDAIYGINMSNNKIGVWNFDYEAINFNQVNFNIKSKKKAEFDPVANDFNSVKIESLRQNKKNSQVKTEDNINIFQKSGQNIASNNDIIQKKMSEMNEKPLYNQIYEPMIIDALPENQRVNLNTTNNDPVNASTTFINFNKNEPIGLDLNNFLSESINDGNFMNDLKHIEKMGELHIQLKAMLTEKVNSLRMISKWWNESSITSALNGVKKIGNKRGVLADFFASTFAQDEYLNLPINLENAFEIIELSEILIVSKYSQYNKIGLKSCYNILKMFQEKIILAKTATVSTGVDLAREERLQKYDKLISLYEKILYSDSFLNLKKKSDQEVVRIVKNLGTEIENLILSCKKNENK